MTSFSRRVIAMIAFILLIGGLGFFAQRYGSIEWLVQNEIELREFVQQNQFRAWFVGLAVYIAFSLVPGTSGKAVVFGWLFGFWQAVLMVDLALTAAAIVSFTTARYLIQDQVNAKFKLRIQKLNHGLEQDGAFYLLLMRLAHVPFTFVNYGSGATSVPLRTFAWTTLLGILPGTMVFVFVGTRIPTLRDIVEKGVFQLLDPLLFSVLAAAIVLPATIHWTIRRYERRRRVSSTHNSHDSHSAGGHANGVH